ncbi:MAG: transglycosylase SLT domain-containing protein [Candidatus Kryptoniota bacterium]
MEKVQSNISPVHPQLTEQQKTKLKAAAKDFEAVFTEYMLKSMQQTEKIDGQDDDDGYGKDIMTGLFNTELSKYISNNSNLGIGNMLYKQLTGEDMDSSDAACEPPTGIQDDTSSNSDSLMQIPLNDRVRQRALDKINVYSSGSILENVGKYSDIVSEAASVYNLKPNLIKAVIAAESAGKSDSLSSKDAKGLMQLEDSTAKEMGVSNTFDPKENIMGGARYLKSLLDKNSGDLESALASYNAGPGVVEQYGGVPPFTETQNYIKKVMNYMQMFDQNEASNDGE